MSGKQSILAGPCRRRQKRVRTIAPPTPNARMTRATVEALADRLGVAIEYERAVQDYPPEVRLDAPDGFTFDGEAHQIVRHSWREAGEALREMPLTECDDPNCEWCES